MNMWPWVHDAWGGAAINEPLLDKYTLLLAGGGSGEGGGSLEGPAKSNIKYPADYKIKGHLRVTGHNKWDSSVF